MTQLSQKLFTRVISLFGLVVLLFFILWMCFLFTPTITSDVGYVYNVPAGASMAGVVNDLYAKGLIAHPKWFNLLVRLKNNSSDLKAGEYLFSKDTTPYQLLTQITTGSGMIYYSFTIIDGWTFKQLRQALIAESRLRHLIANLSDKEIMQKLHHPELSPEGEFFPDTYYFIQGSSDNALLKRAFKNMQRKLTNAWATRSTIVPFHNPQEALIAASLVEKEAHLDQEKPIIAGVLINRLKNNMLLQIDPTVIYGMGELYQGKIHKQDLLTNTPYNTYVNKGLPPTAISMPSLESIKAIMHPQQHEFYYYVAKGDGSHQFSRSLQEHKIAIFHAKSYRSPFFNSELTRYYYQKTVVSPVSMQ